MSKIGEQVTWQGVNKVCSGVVEQRIDEQTVLVRLSNNKYIQLYDIDNEYRAGEVSVCEGENLNQKHDVQP